MKAVRTLIIGLDGATFDLLEPWTQAGHLPALARLMAEGVHGPLLAWPNMNSAASWTSMVTGCNPGQHGIYDFGTATLRHRAAWQPTTAASRARPPFWHFLNTAGQTVGIVNAPISYPADPVNGFMLSGMDAPSVHSQGFAHPAGLLDELRRAGIDYVLDAPDLEGPSKRDPKQAPDLVQRMVDARARTLLHLMRTRDWDTLMAVFIATDRVQHFYWPGADAPLDDAGWAAIRSVYEQIDAFLAAALELVGEDTTVLLVSDHGFGPARYAPGALNRLFQQLGLVHMHQGGGSLSSRLFRHLLPIGRRLVPRSLQPRLTRAFPALPQRSLSVGKYWGIDWSKTQVFAHRAGWKVNINLNGREVAGIVAPQAYDALCERVRDILVNLSDAASGAGVIRRVERREALYHGPYFEEAADLHILWDYEAARDSLCYHNQGEPIIVQKTNGSGSGDRRPGRHRPHGIFIAWGPKIKQGTQVADACTYDIAPTILYLQDQPVPAYMDGRVLSGIFAEEVLRARPPQYNDAPEAAVPAAGTVLDAKEARQVEDRLRQLGYIE